MFERKHTAAAIEALANNNPHPSFMARALRELDEALVSLEQRAEDAEHKLADAMRELLEHKQQAAPATTQNALQTLPADTAPSSSEPAQQAAPVVPAVPAVAQAPAVPQQA